MEILKKEIIYLLFIGAFGGLFSAWITRFWGGYGIDRLFKKKVKEKYLPILRIFIEAIIFLVLLLFLWIASYSI